MTKTKDLSFEKKLEKIRKLLQKMHDGQTDFEENVRIFKEGTTLIQSCRDYLDEAEMEVKKLVDASDEEE